MPVVYMEKIHVEDLSSFAEICRANVVIVPSLELQLHFVRFWQVFWFHPAKLQDVVRCHPFRRFLTGFPTAP